MTLDLDRSILSVRIGQKPYYFRVEDDTLKLSITPINPDPHNFFSTNPPQIKSYLYRMILYSGFLPKRIISFLRKDDDNIRKMMQVNEKLILEIAKELRAKNLDHVFLIFHPHWPGVSRLDSESDWRDPFLRKLLHENNIPYIWSKDLIRKDTTSDKPSFSDYIISGDGHPTAHFTRLIAEEIKRYVLENSRNYRAIGSNKMVIE
jgi:hypothetical protein